MIISMVVAVGANNEIGANGDLLWHLPKDMQRFKEITWNHCVLMGRKTYFSIPEKFRPLKERTNIVLSRSEKQLEEQVHQFSKEKNALEFAKKTGETELMIIGGASIYKQFMNHCDKIYLTRVHASFPHADSFFPEIDTKIWTSKREASFKADEKHLFAFDFITLTQK